MVAQLNKSLVESSVCNSSKMENNTEVHASDFDKICRTCLSTQEILPIFALKHNEIPIVSLLDSCASVHVEKDDDLPQHLCAVCLQEVIKIYQFQERCRQNESALRFALTEPKVTIKQEVDYETIKKDEEFEIPTTNYDSDTETNKTTEQTPLHQKIINTEQTKTFSCRVCAKEFGSGDELKQHRNELGHGKRRQLACSVCGKMFATNHIQQHMRVHTKERPYRCSMCPQTFTMSGSLKRHMMTHTGERPHVCEFCGKGFIQVTHLQVHLRTHSSSSRKYATAHEPKFTCTVCGRSFKRFNPYNIHLKQHDANKLVEKEKKVFEEETYEHVCEICKRVYKTQDLLKKHMVVHGEKTFLCSYCGKSFVTKASLQLHLKVHTGEKSFACTICKKAFAHVATLNAHMWIHTGKKLYKCNVCGKSISQLSHLRSHLRLHTGEKPYSCTYCGKKYSVKGNLTVHIRIHTGEKPYECSVCGKGFHESSGMKKHERGHAEVNLQTSGGDEVVVEDLRD